jgi:DNA-binding NtrC family response regulator
MTILLVEDDPSIALVITAALEAKALRSTHCDSIAERDRLLARAQNFAALVTDVMLPDGDGIETMARCALQRPDMPIIILSAQNTLDTAVRAERYRGLRVFPQALRHRRACPDRPAGGRQYQSAAPSADEDEAPAWRACRWLGVLRRCRRSTA